MVQQYRVLSHGSRVRLCDPPDRRPPDSSVHGDLQARLLEWLSSPPPGDPPDPGIEPASLASPTLAGGLFTTSATLGSQQNVVIVQSRSHVQLFATPRTAECQAPLSFAISWSLHKFMSIES